MILPHGDPRQLGVQEILSFIATEVSVVLELGIRIEEVTTIAADWKPVGEGGVHVSFRLDFHELGERRQGCLLVPLEDVQVLAGGLLMLPDSRLDEARGRQELDRATKEAVMELGMILAGTIESALHAAGCLFVQVHHRGCQGVRPAVPPRLDGYKGGSLLLATCEARIAEYAPATWHLILPPLQALHSEEEE